MGNIVWKIGATNLAKQEKDDIVAKIRLVASLLDKVRSDVRRSTETSRRADTTPSTDEGYGGPTDHSTKILNTCKLYRSAESCVTLLRRHCY